MKLREPGMLMNLLYIAIGMLIVGRIGVWIKRKLAIKNMFTFLK